MAGTIDSLIEDHRRDTNPHPRLLKRIEVLEAAAFGGGIVLSDDTPDAIIVAGGGYSGVSLKASRSDHVHPFPQILADSGASVADLALRSDDPRVVPTAPDDYSVLVASGGVMSWSLGGSFQPYDDDLTEIAALATQPYGRGLLTAASDVAARALLGLAAIASSGSASDLITGTVNDARLSANVALYNVAGTFTQSQTFDLGSGALPAFASTYNQQFANADSQAPRIIGYGFNASGYVTRGFSSSGTRASPTALAGGTAITRFAAGGYDGTVWRDAVGYHSIVSGSSWSGTNREIYFEWVGTPPNSLSAPAEWMRLKDARLTLNSSQASTTTTDGTLVVVGGVGVGGAINVAGSSRLSNANNFFGAIVAAGQSTVFIDGGNSGTNGGSSIFFRQNGTTKVAYGNYSAVIGGAYDDRACIYGPSGITFTPGGFAGQIFNTGGWYVGGTPTDPGTSNLAVQGNLGVGTSTIGARIHAYRSDLTDCYIRAQQGGTGAGSFFDAATGDGTTSNRYAATIHRSLEASGQTWYSGLIGSKDWQIFNATIPATALLVSPTNNNVTIYSSTPSTSAGSGALLIANGGLGVAGDITSAGSLGLGAVFDSSSRLRSQLVTVSNAGRQNGYFDLYVRPSASTTAQYIGVNNNVNADTATTANLTASAVLFGINNLVNLSSPNASTLGAIVGIGSSVAVTHSGSSGTVLVPTVYGIISGNLTLNAAAGTSVTVTTYYGLLIQSASLVGAGTKTITNNYGIAQQDTTATNVFLASSSIFGSDPGGGEKVRVGGNIRASGASHFLGTVSTTGLTTLWIDGGSSGTNGGSLIGLRQNGIAQVAIGNISSILGGAFDARGCIFAGNGLAINPQGQYVSVGVDPGSSELFRVGGSGRFSSSNASATNSLRVNNTSTAAFSDSQIVAYSAASSGSDIQLLAQGGVGVLTNTLGAGITIKSTIGGTANCELSFLSGGYAQVSNAGGLTTQAFKVVGITSTTSLTIGTTDLTFTSPSTDQIRISTAVGSAQLTLSALAGASRSFIMATNGQYRWSVTADTDAEGGSNAGSTFKLNAFSDFGSFIDSPLSIARAAGSPIVCARPIRLSSNYTAGAPAATGYVTLQASNGTTYKVLVST